MQERTARKNIHVVPADADLEVLATHIDTLSSIGERLMASRLKSKTVILLLHDMTGISKGSIRAILEALPDLKKQYVK